MSSITWALQNFINEKVKTLLGNDQHTIALTSALTVTVVGWVTCDGSRILRKWFQSVKSYLRPVKPIIVCTGEARQYHLFIPQFCPDERESLSYSAGTYKRWNYLYSAVSWFLTQHYQCEDDVNAYQSGQAAPLRVLPEASKPQTYRFNKYDIIFTVFTRITDDKTSKEGIDLAGTDTAVLREFVQHCCDQEAQRVSWKQRLYTSEFSSWTSELTHNSKTWDSVVLPRAVKKQLVDDIALFMDSENWYTSKGIALTRGLLLYGLPGTGKTSLIKAISNEYKMNIYSVNLAVVCDDKTLAALFKEIPKKSVVVMEDIDCMGQVAHVRRGEEDLKAKRKEYVPKSSGVTLSGLLNLLDGVASAHGRILIMTTNHKEKLDSALLRPGRCDLQIALGMCNVEQIQDMFTVYIGKYWRENIQVVDIIDRLPEGVLSPAVVSSSLLRYRTQPLEAALDLQRQVQT